MKKKFRSKRTGHSEIYLMDLATGDVHQLTEEGTRLTWPMWINDDEIILTVTAHGLPSRLSLLLVNLPTDE